MTSRSPISSPTLDEPKLVRRPVIGAAVIVVITLVAYVPAIGAGFIWDDDDYVTENTLLHDASGLARIWVPGSTHQYYPLVFTTFWIEYQLWELEPAGYHPFLSRHLFQSPPLPCPPSPMGLRERTRPRPSPEPRARARG